MVASSWGEFWVWSIAAEGSRHSLRQLAHDFAFVAGDFLVDRGVRPAQVLVVLVLRGDKQEFDCENGDPCPLRAPVQALSLRLFLRQADDDLPIFYFSARFFVWCMFDSCSLQQYRVSLLGDSLGWIRDTTIRLPFNGAEWRPWPPRGWAPVESDLFNTCPLSSCRILSKLCSFSLFSIEGTTGTTGRQTGSHFPSGRSNDCCEHTTPRK